MASEEQLDLSVRVLESPTANKTGGSLDDCHHTGEERAHGSDMMSPIPPRKQRDRIFSTPGRVNDLIPVGLRIQIPDFRNPDTVQPIDKVEEWLLSSGQQEPQSPRPSIENRFWRSVSSPVLPKGRSLSHAVLPLPGSPASEAPSGSTQFVQAAMGSSTLSPLDERQIRRLIGDRRLILTPLYQASVHGFDTHVFHSLCDKRGPSVAIVTLSSGLCFGCYTGSGWFSRGESVNDKKAFLFRAKDHPADVLKIVASQSDTDLHICDDPDLGPFFGSLENPSLRLFCKVYGSKCAKVYKDGPFGSLLELAGVEEGSLDLADVEIFDASQRYPPIVERPWRDVSLNQASTLVDGINYFVTYRSEFCQIDYVNILLLGPSGSGKSSVFNTFESTFKGHITSRARTGDGVTSATTQFRRYATCPQRSKVPLNVRICDTPGVSLSNVTTTDLVYMLDGHLSDRFAIASGSLITNRSPGFISDTSLRDEMHCVALVLDATNIPLPGSQMHSKLLELKEQIDVREIPIRVILTKVDLACKHVEANTAFVYRSLTITDVVDLASHVVGVPRNCIYPLKCYEHELKQVQNIGILVLSALKHIVYAAESALEDRESLQPVEPTQKLRSGSNLSGGSGTGAQPAAELINRLRSESRCSNLSGGSVSGPIRSPTITLRNRPTSDIAGSAVFRRSMSDVPAVFTYPDTTKARSLEEVLDH